METQIIEVASKKHIKDFVKLPFSLYKNDANWIPPIIKDELKSLNKNTNPVYEFCDAKFWLAYNKNGECVGRIAAIINNEYNKLHNIKKGRISRLEFIDETSVSDALFKTAESWLKEKGMTQVHGPLGFTNLDNQGLLIEGFNHLPSIASVYHKSYYQNHFDNLGYQKENDWLEFKLILAESVPEKATRLSDMIKERYKLKVISFTSMKQAMPYVPKIFKLLNQAFADLPYVTPFSDKMIEFYRDKYFKLLNPKFIKVIELESDELAGFIVGVPSLSKAMQKVNGSLFPFGFMHLLKAMKNPEVVDLFLTGVPQHLQGQGVPALLINELQSEMVRQHVKFVETTGIFESNQKAIVTWKNYENIQHKRRRCYIKDL